MVQLIASVGSKKTCADISSKDNSHQTKAYTLVEDHRRQAAAISNTSLCNIYPDKWRRVREEKRSPLKSHVFKVRRTLSVNFILLASLFLLSSFVVVAVDACNESICASIVSKCTLLRSCDCDIEPTGCSCCKKCFACLDFLQVECCSCVGLCPMPNATLSAGAPQKSVVADFEESVPQLWEALTDGEDLQGRWQKYTYPVDVKTQQPSKKEEVDPVSVQETVLKSETSTLNCTVVFLSQCMAEKKCEISCRSMGASAYRWFTDGCCECVGHGCVSYGINESRCEMCSYDDDDDQLLPDNISDDELERLEQMENMMMQGANEENSTPDEEARSEAPPKKSKKLASSIDN
jgi:hypothetical protein